MDIIAIFVLYFTGFAIIHSILATDYIKNRVKRLVGNSLRFYRIIYTFLSFITFSPSLIVWLYYSSKTPVLYTLPEWMLPVLLFIRIAGLGLFVYALFQTDLRELIGIKQMQDSSGHKPVLITNGAYGVVRHPLYAGGIMVLFAKMGMTMLDMVAISLISAYLIIGAYIEEKRLRSVFGDEYKQYMAKVSMFIPMKRVVKLLSKK